MDLFNYVAELEEQNKIFKRRIKELETKVNAYKRINESLNKENRELKRKFGIEEEIVQF